MSTTKVITGKVRFSYAHVFEPKAISDGDEPKYSISLLIDKSDTVTLTKIKAAIEAAKEEGKSKWGGKVPANLKLPLRDGDAERAGDPAYGGKYFINATSFRKPQVVDADLNPVLDKDEVYSGCYGRVSLNFYAFAVSGNKGIAAGLNNVQKLEDGERLSGGATAEEDFSDSMLD